ncbi:MAG: dihydrodipicolinate reductase [Acidobacteria bacterium OLB17]|nr:MAG: dihydrodipicolinate reductase [Acidobacteria bacterium OLB17]
MGKLVERLALEKGNEIGAVIDEGDRNLFPGEVARKLAGCDVAIDFSHGMGVRRNVEACVLAKVPVVVGTTGWAEQLREVEAVVNDGGGACVYGANFSIGVNLFYRIADFAAELFAKFPEYEPFIEEQHHSRKKDAPSGTALKIEEIAEAALERGSGEKVRVPVVSTRAGNIPGTHRLGFDGPADQISLEHMARSREGFASGALLAAEWIVGRTGFFEFSAVLDREGK